MFKLQQMQAVDASILERLSTCFSDLDTQKTGQLRIGVEVPSASQVKSLQESASKKIGVTVVDEWKAFQAKVKLGEGKAKSAAASARGDKKSRRKSSREFTALSAAAGVGSNAKNVGKCHDFKWSRSLWTAAARDLGRWAAIYATIYAVSFYFFVARASNFNGVGAWYFLVASTTTIGYGDFSPTTQASRAAAIVLLPQGIILISFLVACFQAWLRSLPAHYHKVQTPAEKAADSLFKAMDINKNGTIEKSEVVAKARLIDMAPEEAAAWFDKIDVDSRCILGKRGDTAR